MKYLICDVENITTLNSEAPNGCYYPNSDQTKHARFQTFPSSFRAYTDNITGSDGDYNAIFTCDDTETIPTGYKEITQDQAEQYKEDWTPELDMSLEAQLSRAITKEEISRILQSVV